MPSEVLHSSRFRSSTRLSFRISPHSLPSEEVLNSPSEEVAFPLLRINLAFPIVLHCLSSKEGLYSLLRRSLAPRPLPHLRISLAPPPLRRIPLLLSSPACLPLRRSPACLPVRRSPACLPSEEVLHASPLEEVLHASPQKKSCMPPP